MNTLFIEPGSPWENGYVESFNGKLRDELLDGESFYTLREAKRLWYRTGGKVNCQPGGKRVTLLRIGKGLRLPELF